MERILLRELFFQKSWNMGCFTWNRPYLHRPKKISCSGAGYWKARKWDLLSWKSYRIEKDDLLAGLAQDISNGMKHFQFLEYNTFFWYKILLTITNHLIQLSLWQNNVTISILFTSITPIIYRRRFCGVSVTPSKPVKSNLRELSNCKVWPNTEQKWSTNCTHTRQLINPTSSSCKNFNWHSV